jgi:hypothetical protein
MTDIPSTCEEYEAETEAARMRGMNMNAVSIHRFEMRLYTSAERILPRHTVTTSSQSSMMSPVRVVLHRSPKESMSLFIALEPVQ